MTQGGRGLYRFANLSKKKNFALLKREKYSGVQMYSGRPQRTTILLV